MSLNAMQKARKQMLDGIERLLDKYGSEKVLSHREEITNYVALMFGVRKALAEEYLTTVLKGRQAKLILEYDDSKQQ